MPIFATETGFASAVTDAFATTQAPPGLRAALVAGVSEGEAASRAMGAPPDGALTLTIGGWVLRTQDLPVLELIGIVGAAAAAALAPGAVAAAIVTTALADFAKLCWTTWRRGAALSKAEIGVLGFVRLHGPISDAALLEKASAALGLTAAEIGNATTTLQQTELLDGDVIALISKDAAGGWRARTG